jgi:hypothetical protein
LEDGLHSDRKSAADRQDLAGADAVGRSDDTIGRFLESRTFQKFVATLLGSHVLYFRPEEGTMIDREDRKRVLHRVAASFLVLAIPMAGFIFGAAAGEDPAGSGQIEPGTSLAAKIEKKALVQVITASGTTEIRYPRVVPGGITSQGGAAPIPWSEVRKIRYQGQATMTGMWVGFGIGAAVGTAACIGAAADNVDFYWWSYPLIIGTTSILGAGTGALIGMMIPKWKTLYDAPAGTPMVARLSLAPMRRGGAMILTLAF